MVPPIEPIRPQDAKKQLPATVIGAINNLIEQCLAGNVATFTQDEAVAALLAADASLTRERIFSEHLLDFEDVYRAQGWKVIFDKPGYNESYKASFTFTKPS